MSHANPLTYNVIIWKGEEGPKGTDEFISHCLPAICRLKVTHKGKGNAWYVRQFDARAAARKARKGGYLAVIEHWKMVRDDVVYD